MIWPILINVNIHLPNDWPVPLWVLALENWKHVHIKPCFMDVHSSLICDSQKLKTNQMSLNRWVDKQMVVYFHNGILLSHKKEWNNAICSNMDATRDYHTKRSKSERQIPYDITYMWNLKYGTDEPIYETETDSQTWRADLWLPRWRWGRDGLGVWD